jgi:hypothetical protein
MGSILFAVWCVMIAYIMVKGVPGDNAGPKPPPQKKQ